MNGNKRILMEKIALWQSYASCLVKIYPNHCLPFMPFLCATPLLALEA